MLLFGKSVYFRNNPDYSLGGSPKRYHSIEDGGGGGTNTRNNSISEFIDDAIHKTISNQAKMDLWEVDNREAQELKEKTGLNLQGYVHKLENYGLRHLWNRHSNEKGKIKDAVSITEDDLLKIPHILANYDDVSLSPNKNGAGNEVLIYSKKYNDIIYYLEEIRSGKKELVPQTLYKNKSGNVSMLPKNPRDLTSETFLPQHNNSKLDTESQGLKLDKSLKLVKRTEIERLTEREKKNKPPIRLITRHKTEIERLRDKETRSRQARITTGSTIF